MKNRTKNNAQKKSFEFDAKSDFVQERIELLDTIKAIVEIEVEKQVASKNINKRKRNINKKKRNNLNNNPNNNLNNNSPNNNQQKQLFKCQLFNRYIIALRRLGKAIGIL